jgi:anti-anti-sigma factor
MSLQFLSHSWQVENLEDGIMVTVHQQELDSRTLWILADELFELAQECGQPNLCVDFGKVYSLPSAVLGILIKLDKQLRNIWCRMILNKVGPLVYQSLRAARLTENLDIRERVFSDADTL